MAHDNHPSDDNVERKGFKRKRIHQITALHTKGPQKSNKTYMINTRTDPVQFNKRLQT